MVSFPMPFRSVPCSIWLPTLGAKDDYGNQGRTYSESPDIQTRCVYAPGDSKPQTGDDFEDGRPYGAEVTMTFFLPKTVDADLRGARISCSPPDDPTLSGLTFEVVGEPYSYPRANTPGDYSWRVEGVRVDG